MAHKTPHTSKGRVPSVTTITSLWGDKGGLLYWANQAGLDGKTLEEARQSAATPGSMAHDAVDHFIKGKPFTFSSWSNRFPDVVSFAEAEAKARMAFHAFRKWADQTQFSLLEGEIHLVSEKYQYGGTMDAVMTAGGIAVADWKTGGGGRVYVDHLYQIAAYWILWEENFPDMKITDGAHLIKFNNETGDFSHRQFSDLEQEKEAFLKLREVYEIHKQAKKRV